MGKHATAIIAAAGALLLSSCAALEQGPSLDEALTSAVDAQVNNVTMAESDCITTTIVSEVGEERLTRAGVDADGLLAEPELLRTGDIAADVDAVIASCLDLQARFAVAVATAGAESLDSECVAAESFENEPLTLALIDGAPLTSTGPDLTTAVVDAVRGCVDDDDFAELAGLDSPTALRPILIADPFATSEEAADQNSCIVDTVMDEVGIERLAELGVTVETPDFLAVINDLPDEEIDVIAASLEPCDLAEGLTIYVSDVETQVGACAVDRLAEEDVASLATERLRGRAVIGRTALRQAIDACVAEEVEALFGPRTDLSPFMQEFTFGFVEGISSGIQLNRFERSCVTRGVASVYDESEIVRVEDAFALAESGEASSDDLNRIDALFAGSFAISDACIEPWKTLAAELEIAGISDGTIECVAQLAPDLPSALNSANQRAFEGDIDASFELDELFETMSDALVQCGSQTEIRSWEAYVSGADEPAPIEA